MPKHLKKCPVCGKRHQPFTEGSLTVSVSVQDTSGCGIWSGYVDIPIARDCLPGAVRLVKEDLLPGILEMLGEEEDHA